MYVTRGSCPIPCNDPLSTGIGEDELAPQVGQPECSALDRLHLHKIDLNAVGREVAIGDRHDIARTARAVVGADSIPHANGNRPVSNQTLQERYD